MTDYQTIHFVIYGSQDHLEECDGPIESPILRAHGYFWTIKVYSKRDMPTDPEIMFVAPWPTRITKNSLHQNSNVVFVVKKGVHCAVRQIIVRMDITSLHELIFWQIV